MREIKFRVWDVDYKLMRYPIGIDWENQHTDGTCVYYWIKNNDGSKRGIPAHRTLIEIMQYTGLKDKNGREIYEGDIVVEEIETGKYQPFVVKWHDDYAGFDMSSSPCWTILGNIYENPELL